MTVQITDYKHGAYTAKNMAILKMLLGKTSEVVEHGKNYFMAQATIETAGYYEKTNYLICIYDCKIINQ